MAYTKRYAGGFFDFPTTTTPIDSAFLNAVEAALLVLGSNDGTVDGQVLQWISGSSKFGPALLLNKNVDAAAGIVKSKLDFTGANGLVNADVAGAAAIARSKLNFGAGLVDADISAVAAIANSKLAIPLITTSSLAGGPPGTPNDKDIWIATAVDANGTRWTFQYNAGSGSSFKWEFIGGSAARVVVDGDEVIGGTNAWLNCVTTGPDFVASRAGDYLIRFAARSQSPAGGATTIHVGIANASVSTTPIGETATEDQTAATKYVNVGNETKLPGISAGQTLRMQYFSTSQLSTFGMRTIHVTPVRVI